MLGQHIGGDTVSEAHGLPPARLLREIGSPGATPTHGLAPAWSRGGTDSA